MSDISCVSLFSPNSLSALGSPAPRGNCCCFRFLIFLLCSGVWSVPLRRLSHRALSSSTAQLSLEGTPADAYWAPRCGRWITKLSMGCIWQAFGVMLGLAHSTMSRSRPFCHVTPLAQVSLVPWRLSVAKGGTSHLTGWQYSWPQIPSSASHIWRHTHKSIQRIALSIPKLPETNMQNETLTLDSVL